MLSQCIVMVVQDMFCFEKVNGIYVGFMMMGCGYQMLCVYNVFLFVDLNLINKVLGEGIGCWVEVLINLVKGDLFLMFQKVFFGDDEFFDFFLCYFVIIVVDVVVVD